jgi:hypothetical protein
MMAAMEAQTIFNKLLQCRSRADVAALLASLGDSPDVSIDVPFGPNGLMWHPFGDTASNISAIGLGTKPGKSLTERVTNAIDAILQDRAEQVTTSLPSSPQEAAQAWFKRPISGPGTGLFQEKIALADRRIGLVLLNSGVEESPTVDVIDAGVGIKPEEMKDTILSLRAGNKIKNRYLIGAFGQGGSSTLAFSEYVIIISRHRSDPVRIGFTIIRVMRLDATYKEDCYVYLCNQACDVPQIEAPNAAESIDLYTEAEKGKPPEFSQGTLVRHVGYRLTGIAKALGPASGNLYHYLHYTLFDPLLPFRIWDLRGNASSQRMEFISGSRNRLMKLAMKSGDSDQAGNVVVRHSLPMEYIVPAGSDKACIGVEYWVVLAYKSKDNDQLRANSSEVFVQGSYPIIGTLNGQTQGELPPHLLRELGLALLSKHMVVHIDASAADSTVRRELFATSREGFKDGPVLDSIIIALRKILQDDTELPKIEAELTERIAKREAATTREEVRKQVTRLLKEIGVQVSATAVSEVVGVGEPKVVHPRPPRPPVVPREPLPTLPYPNATFIRFKAPDQHLEAHLQESETIHIETDADAEFDRRDRIGIHATGEVLEVESKSKLSGGRMRWRLRPKADTPVGTTGELRTFINLPNGNQLSASISFEVLPPVERPSKEAQTVVPPFEIKAINPSDPTWDDIWEDNGDPDKQRKHAYAWLMLSGVTYVFYSEVFPPFADTLAKLKTSKADLVEAFTTNYEVWIAYHAILQKKADDAMSVEVKDETVRAQIMDTQRSIVATMQAKQSMQFAEVWKRGLIDHK